MTLRGQEHAQSKWCLMLLLSQLQGRSCGAAELCLVELR